MDVPSGRRPGAAGLLVRAARVVAAALVTSTVLAAPAAQAFCGFYVGKADASLFNEASQVILARDGRRTVISMLNDYKGDLGEFALVVPVPTVLSRGQIHVGERRIFDRIDAWSSPRLVEYHDDDPCRRAALAEQRNAAPAADAGAAAARREKATGVTVEASYTIGEYDIVILSAEQSDGLERWLRGNGYRIPAGASTALGAYIRQGMKFFVARVNLAEQRRAGYQTLRPLQFAFESDKFMLPMRLGMINAAGPQDLIVYVLTRRGRVESSNYRTVKLPANVELPVIVRDDFKRFYRALFDRQAEREQFKAVFTEYFWDMGWCDPCAAEPLNPTELRQAGVFWLDEGREPRSGDQGAPPAPARRIIAPGGGAQPVMLTRLHLRYTAASFPEDLMLQETGDRANFQTRYVLRHAWTGSQDTCPAAAVYFDQLRRRQEREARTLADLSGWDLAGIQGRMNIGTASRPWWEALWQ